MFVFCLSDVLPTAAAAWIWKETPAAADLWSKGGNYYLVANIIMHRHRTLNLLSALTSQYLYPCQLVIIFAIAKLRCVFKLNTCMQWEFQWVVLTSWHAKIGKSAHGFKNTRFPFHQTLAILTACSRFLQLKVELPCYCGGSRSAVVAMSTHRLQMPNIFRYHQIFLLLAVLGLARADLQDYGGYYAGYYPDYSYNFSSPASSPAAVYTPRYKRTFDEDNIDLSEQHWNEKLLLDTRVP